MKKSVVLVNLLLLFVICAFLPGRVSAQEKFSVEQIVLENGFTVYLNVDTNAAEVFGCVVVKAGSKDDPEGGSNTKSLKE